MAAGGQPVSEESVDTVLAAYDEHVISLDEPANSEACHEALDRTAKRHEFTIVRARYRQ